ncbi:MAG: hypothetical protein U0794_11475 [Isosphaeraceae bacterium]
MRRIAAPDARDPEHRTGAQGAGRNVMEFLDRREGDWQNTNSLSTAAVNVLATPSTTAIQDCAETMQDFEILGQFYLGRAFDVKTRKASDDLILYDSRDLVTHAVCVGMTGSGKTGLCISLLEEAAIDQIPAIAIDPKGDIANLLLTFPKLRGEDFEPWVDPGDARKAGLSTSDYAAKQAETWKKGLAEWGEDGDRIERLRASAEFRIYTPGSNAGIPLSILKSFAAPPEAIRDDPEALNDRVSTTADSLLALLGIDADPMQSREHILVSSILAHAWKAGTDLEIAALIPLIQNPPFSRVGVIELESFFPAKDRFALSLRLNNLLAAPAFESWMRGEPLDVASLLNAPDGKPRISIISIAHLGESERMFLVSLLLNQVLGWVRTQPGTSSLRAILYMDEIFGFFPPVASPPSKKPLLTLLKQARAYGLGVVLATQNPADLDYKGLSNTGTWFLGRLQAERDKMRVLEGLEGAAAAQSARFDRAEMDTILSGLGPRTFLMHNVHEDHPETFQVRWALSYLRGPLTRQQIKQLMDPVREAATTAPPPSPSAASMPDTAQPPAQTAPTAPVSAPPPKSASGVAASSRPLLPPDITQVFVPTRSTQPAGASLLYKPAVLGLAEVHYLDTKAGVDLSVTVARLAPLASETLTVEWADALGIVLTADELATEPAGAASYDPLPGAASKARSYSSWSKAFVDSVYRTETLELWKSPMLGLISTPDESERDFRVRLQQAAKEQRDARVDALRAKYAPKLAALEEKVRRADQAVERETAQARNSTLSSLVRVGSTVLGAFLSRKTLSTSNVNKAGTAIRNVGVSMKESSDVTRARDTAEALRQQLFDLETEFRTEVRSLEASLNPLAETLSTLTIKPKKTNITTKLVALAWAPYWVEQGHAPRPAWS